MDDYISRQAVLNLVKDICVPTKYGYTYQHRCIDADEIRELPSADVVEVVRCKDCKYGRYDIFDRGMYCGRKYVTLDTYEDDFCSYGEEK